MSGRVVVVEDDPEVREALGTTLELAGYEPVLAQAFIIAKDHLSRSFDGVVLSDIRMPGRDGMYLLDYAKSRDPELPVILLTGEGDIPLAVEAMGRGAFDFLEKPCSNEVLLGAIRNAMKARELVMENRALKARLVAGDAAEQLVHGVSESIVKLREQIRRIAPVDEPVLVAGPPGSGVARVAEALHMISARASSEFRKMGATGLSPEALSDALQGAPVGTVFLDQISELLPETQFRLLELIEDPASARLIAGTTVELRDRDGFNEKLYFRLEGLAVQVPPLKDRPEDIPFLFRLFVAETCEEAGISGPDITDGVIATLLAQDWPGNSMSLRGAARRFTLGLGAEEFDPALGLDEKLEQIQRSLIADALQREGGKVRAAAKRLKISDRTLYARIERLGMSLEKD